MCNFRAPALTHGLEELIAKSMKSLEGKASKSQHSKRSRNIISLFGIDNDEDSAADSDGDEAEQHLREK